MAVTHSTESRVFVNSRHLSGAINEYTASHSRENSETTSLLDGGVRYIPGILSGSLNISGMFEAGAGNIHETVNAARGTDNGLLVTVTPAGYTVGSPAYITQADISGYEVESEVGDAVSLSIESEANDGVDWGVVLHPHESETASGSEASVDNSSDTDNGGVASLHVTAASGTSPTLDVKVQHSPDDATWVDLITFDTATDVDNQFKTVSGTVDQFVRVEFTIAGTSPDFTFAVAFARR